MKIEQQYRYLISENLDNCGNAYIETEGIIDFDITLNIIFNNVKLAFQHQKGMLLDNIHIEFIDSHLPYASIQNCLGEHTICFSKGMKKLLYAFSYLCVIGYQYNCFLKQNPENLKEWCVQLKIFDFINELLNNFFVEKNYEFDLLYALKELEICFVHELQEWAYQAHEVYEGAIHFILAHEIGHVFSEVNQSKLEQEEYADKIAIEILTSVSEFKKEGCSSPEYLKEFLESDFYATYKNINFTLFLFMLIDIKQEKMKIYTTSCGMEPDEHPSAEHRSNRLIFASNFAEFPTDDLFLNWRSSLVYVFAFLNGNVGFDNLSVLKENIKDFKEDLKS